MTVEKHMMRRQAAWERVAASVVSPMVGTVITHTGAVTGSPAPSQHQIVGSYADRLTCG